MGIEEGNSAGAVMKVRKQRGNLGKKWKGSLQIAVEQGTELNIFWTSVHDNEYKSMARVYPCINKSNILPIDRNVDCIQ